MTGRAETTSTFDFHGFFSIRAEHRGLNDLLRRELAAFARGLTSVDLTVSEGLAVPLGNLLSTKYSFDRSSFVVQTPAGRLRLADRILEADPSYPAELLLIQWVENLMRQQIVFRGATLVHSSAVCRDGVGYLLPAWAHTGKTNVALSFLRDGYSYMADDWCFVSESGEILGYPRWLNLFDYNFEVRGARAPSLDPRVLKRLRRRLAVAEFARSLRESHRLSRWLRRWLLERHFVNVRVPASVAVPGCTTELRAPLSKVCLLATSQSGSVRCRELEPTELARRLVLCAQYERSTFGMHQLALMYSGVLVPPPDLVSREEAVLARGFRSSRCLEVALPPSPSAGDLDRVRRAIETA